MFYLNPYVSILEFKNKIYIKSIIDLEFDIDKKNAFNFLQGKESITKEELLLYFNNDEISKLIKARLLLKNKLFVPDKEDMLSRQRGFFSIVSQNYRLIEDKFRNLNVIILGAGAIGTHLLWNLISIGIKNVTIVDYDIVERSNLNRQLFYGYNDIGLKKVIALKKQIDKKFPNVNLKIIDAKIFSVESLNIIKTYDFVFKAFDSPETSTYWVNRKCVEYQIPFISGGFLNQFGIVGPIYIPNVTNCYSCINEDEGTRYNEVSPTFSIIVINVVSKMMLIFMNIIMDKVEKISQYYVFNVFTEKWKPIDKSPKKTCEICGQKPLEGSVSAKFLIKYLLIFITSVCISVVSLNLGNFFPNYLFVITVILLKSHDLDDLGYIMGYSSIIVTVNIISYYLYNNQSRIINNLSVLTTIQNIALNLIFIGILTTIISMIRYYVLKILLKIRGENNVKDKEHKQEIQ